MQTSLDYKNSRKVSPAKRSPKKVSTAKRSPKKVSPAKRSPKKVSTPNNMKTSADYIASKDLKTALSETPKSYLYKMCSKMNIRNRSKMNKKQLMYSLLKHKKMLFTTGAITILVAYFKYNKNIVNDLTRSSVRIIAGKALKGLIDNNSKKADGSKKADDDNSSKKTDGDNSSKKADGGNSVKVVESVMLGLSQALDDNNLLRNKRGEDDPKPKRSKPTLHIQRFEPPEPPKTSMDDVLKSLSGQKLVTIVKRDDVCDKKPYYKSINAFELTKDAIVLMQDSNAIVFYRYGEDPPMVPCVGYLDANYNVKSVQLPTKSFNGGRLDPDFYVKKHIEWWWWGYNAYYLKMTE